MNIKYTSEEKAAQSRPDANSICICNSGKLFGDCCGSMADDRLPPHGVVIKHNAVSEKFCDELMRYARKQNRQWLSVGTYDAKGGLVPVRDERRVTELVNLGKWKKKVSNLIEKNLTEIIKDQYGETLAWFEAPQLLFYSPGGRYEMHSDADIYFPGLKKWTRNFDRDYSVLVYLNDDYVGGNITFNLFNYSYHPQKGDVVFFPSGYQYMHSATPVKKGFRYAIVSWCAVKESRKLRDEPPPGAIMMP